MTDPVLKVRGCRWIDVPGASDARGSVNFLEFGKALDFQPRRIFWLHHVAPDQWRGRHGHRESKLVLVALNGHCLVHLDDGTVKAQVRLDDPAKALYMEPWVWHELTDFAPQTAVMVIASSFYEEAEYLRDYETFRREVGARGR
ncbi:MAG: FdtA/QdtA family cupin domain-containing protein [Proteobacteria bacterium]|nr:FdtA/QdtA family cupin domain-containing protein [Pseudomonadota bacterium]